MGVFLLFTEENLELRMQLKDSPAVQEVKRLEGVVAQLEESARKRQADVDKLNAAAKEFNTILKARRDAFDNLDKGAKEQNELNRKAINELKVQILGLEETQKELKSELGRMDRAVKAYYPEVTDEAKKSQLASLQVLVTDAAMSDCHPTTEDRVVQLADEARTLANTCREVFECLWPKETAPRDFSELAQCLDDAPNTILALQESAARQGAEWTLTLMVSWYPAAKPEQLTVGFRGSDSHEDLGQRPGIRTTACTIADFVNLEEFIPDRTNHEAADGEGADEDEEELDEDANEGHAKGKCDVATWVSAAPARSRLTKLPRATRARSRPATSPRGIRTRSRLNEQAPGMPGVIVVEQLDRLSPECRA